MVVVLIFLFENFAPQALVAQSPCAQINACMLERATLRHECYFGNTKIT